MANFLRTAMLLTAFLLQLFHPAKDALAAEEEVTLQLKWTHCFQFAGYYAALEKGYYREAGLDVHIKELTPDIDVVNEVVGGKADFGIGNSSLLLARKNGQPVVLVANILQHSPLVIIAAKHKPSESIHDLVGKRIMMESLSDEVLAYFKHERLPLDQIRQMPHSFNLEGLVSGKTDAMTAYVTNEPYFLDRMRFSYQMYSPRSAGIDFYGDNLFTSEQQLRDHPKRVKAFREASLRGWEYAVHHQDEIIELLLKKYPKPDNTREYYQFESKEILSLIRADLVHIGYMNPGRWRHIADVYAEIGMLPQSFDLNGFIFDDSPESDLRKLSLYLSIALTALAIFGGFALYSMKMNKQLIRLQAKLEEYHSLLERKVSERTIALSIAKESAEATERAKSSFLANMGHELRTPITMIMGYLFLIKRGVADESTSALIGSAEQATQQLNELINDILDYTCIEADRFSIESIPFSLKPVIELAAASISQVANAKGIKVSVEVDPAIPATLKGDPIRIGQILESLLSNAVKFSEDGQINIRVRHDGNDPEGVRLRFDVKDQGIGISPELKEGLFQLFNQGNNSATREHEGTGLGLALSRQLVNMMGGQIGVDSVPGYGSNFWFTLVIEVSQQSTIGKHEDHSTDWNQLGFIVTYLGKLLAIDDVHARSLWAENSQILHPLLLDRGVKFQRSMEAFDFPRALALLLEAIAERPELKITPAPWNNFIGGSPDQELEAPAGPSI